MKVETSNLQSICACHVIVQRQTRSCLAVVGVVVGVFVCGVFFFTSVVVRSASVSCLLCWF